MDCLSHHHLRVVLTDRCAAPWPLKISVLHRDESGIIALASSWTRLSHVRRGRPGCLVQLVDGFLPSMASCLCHKLPLISLLNEWSIFCVILYLGSDRETLLHIVSRLLKVGFHYPSSWAELTACELWCIFWHPSTRAVNSGSGNRP